jgi:hypothetical protein
VSWHVSGDSGNATFFFYFSAFEPGTQPFEHVQMRTGPFKPGVQGSFSSLPLVAWSFRQATAHASLSKHPLIEKPDRIDPKLPLYFLKRAGYGPSAACLALTLRQTYKEK